LGWKLKKPKFKLPKLKTPKSVKTGLLKYKGAVDKSVKKNFGLKASKALQAKGKAAAADFKKGNIIAGTMKTVSIGTKVTGSGTVGTSKKIAKTTAKIATAPSKFMFKNFKKPLIIAGVATVGLLYVAIKLR